MDAKTNRAMLACLGLALLLGTSGAATAADWFVAPGPAGGDGSKGKPFHDPWKALAVVTPGDVIHIAQGVYYARYDRSSWIVDRPRVTVLGGYDAGFTSRDPWKRPSVFAFYREFEGTNENNLMQGMEDHSGLVLDGVAFDGAGRNLYDDKSPFGMKSGYQMVGPLVSFNSPEVTIRNCVFINSLTGAAELRSDGCVFENNIVLNHRAQAMLDLRDAAGGTKKPMAIRGNTFAFAYDDSDPPMGRGGEKGVAIRVASAAVIEKNAFVAAGNTGIAVWAPADKVAINNNAFLMSMRANIASREGGRENMIGNKNLDELEDLGFKSAQGNKVIDAGLEGLKPEWIDAVTKHFIASYATPPKEALAALRQKHGLMSVTTVKEGEGMILAPRVDPIDACGVRVAGEAGAKPVEVKPQFSSTAAAAAAGPYQRIEWAELAAGSPALDGKPVEVRAAIGNERHGFVLKGITQDKYLGFDVFYFPDQPENMHMFAVRHSVAHRQWDLATKSNNGREASDWYLLRGICRLTGARQKATIEVQSIVPVVAPAKPLPPRPQGRDWFVRAGSSGGDGTKEKPFRDPFQALEKAEGGDSIHVATGDYYGKLRSAQWKVSVRHLAMLGGYDAEFTARDPWKNPTRLVMTPDAKAEDKSRHSGEFLETTEICDGFVLDGFVFDGATVNNYFDAAGGGGLNIRGTPIGPMIQLLGGDLTVRNCVFVNASGLAADLSASRGVFVNNVIVNTSGAAVQISANGEGPWIIRNNTILFAYDPTPRAGTGKSTGFGNLLQLRGRAAFKVEGNILGFADNVGIRAPVPRAKLSLDRNVLVANTYNHYTDANLVYLFDEVWDRRLADAELASAQGIVRELPSGLPLDAEYVDKALPRLFELKGRMKREDWVKVASAAGSKLSPPEPAPTANGTSPVAEKPKKEEGPPKEKTLEEMMAELSALKTEAEKASPTATAAPPKGPAYAPAYPWKKALDLAVDKATAGAQRMALQVNFTGAVATVNREYAKITFAQVADVRDTLAGKPVEFDAKRPRSSGSGGTPPAELSDELFTAYNMNTLDGSHPRTAIIVFVRRDTNAAKAIEKAALTDTIRVRGVAQVLPNYRALIVVADTIGPAE